MTKNIIQDGETPRKQKLENSNSEEVRDFQNTQMTAVQRDKKREGKDD